MTEERGDRRRRVDFAHIDPGCNYSDDGEDEADHFGFLKTGATSRPPDPQTCRLSDYVAPTWLGGSATR
eukprot:1077739-Prorocentrum_minimum.AAC.2